MGLESSGAMMSMGLEAGDHKSSVNLGVSNELMLRYSQGMQILLQLSTTLGVYSVTPLVKTVRFRAFCSRWEIEARSETAH